jgi:hypothetical protein
MREVLRNFSAHVSLSYDEGIAWTALNLKKKGAAAVSKRRHVFLALLTLTLYPTTLSTKSEA